ncbi:MAG: hypothetical protein MJ175_03750 [Clostridia bacterium]|nr:hypothetical protein [Clostridia bacterium]
MMTYYLELGLAVLLLSLQFCMTKFYQSKNGSAIRTSLLFTASAGLAVGVMFWVFAGFHISITPFSLLCAVGIAGLCLGYNLLGFRIFSIGSFAVFNLFLMLGGMMLPFLWGMLFLGDYEAMSGASFIGRMAGIVLLTVSMALGCAGEKQTAGADKKKKILFIVLCAAVFFMNGFVSVISKLHQIHDPSAIVGGTDFVFWTNSLNGIGSLIALLILSMKKEKKPMLSGKFPVWLLLVTVVIYALANGVSYLLQLSVAASPLPASVQYPMMTGGSIVLSALAGRLFFGEKQSKTALCGTILAFAATFLFLI